MPRSVLKNADVKCPQCGQSISDQKPFYINGRLIKPHTGGCNYCYGMSIIKLIEKLIAKKYFKIINGAVIINAKRIAEAYGNEACTDYGNLTVVFLDLGVLTLGTGDNEEYYYLEVDGEKPQILSTFLMHSDVYYSDRGVAEQMLKAEKAKNKSKVCRLLKVSVAKIM